MAAKETKKGNILYQAGQPLDNLHIIAGGKVRAFFPGGELLLGKGDVIGLCDLYQGSHSLSYETIEDTQTGVYPYHRLADLQALLKIPEITHFFLYSSARQTAALFHAYEISKQQADDFHKMLFTYYNSYKSLCESTNAPVKSLSTLESAEKLSVQNKPDYYLAPYYTNFNAANTVKYSFLSSSALAEGFLMQASKDVQSVVTACQEIYDYMKLFSSNLLNRDSIDLYELFTSLRLYLKSEEADCTKTDDAIASISEQIERCAYVDKDLCQQRFARYQQRLENSEAVPSVNEVNDSDLEGSLDRILSYTGLDITTCQEFKKLLEQYKNMADKNGTDDNCRTLRLKITKAFYPIYMAAFLNSLKDSTIPVPVKMFLHFGYMDEGLAGFANAKLMYRLAIQLDQKAEGRVYTFYQWLLAIYNGKKEPSRNEFDNDFPAHLREQKNKGEITEAEEAEKLKNPIEWVKFELESVFPTVHKITFGRITTFCPVFSEHNVFKTLDQAFVTETAVDTVFQMIRNTDYSAYYRETNFSSPEHNIVREPIQVEILPDIILTPCAGNRSVMWQEIEGKKRTTPARMFLPAFHMESLSDSIIRLTGEYRWEMCKRIQGVRWNDLSERSLTSEYCDYAQFYRKNPDLSTDAKDKVKTALQKAKNNYKEMFVNDYTMWILFEGNGSPRLNKVARAILFMHCPFSAGIRAKLTANPLYKEMLEAYNVRTGQKLHHVEAACQRFRVRGDAVPEELEKQKAFLES